MSLTAGPWEHNEYGESFRRWVGAPDSDGLSAYAAHISRRGRVQKCHGRPDPGMRRHDNRAEAEAWCDAKLREAGILLANAVEGLDG